MMRTSREATESEQTELARLREENRRLRGLLVEQQQNQAMVAATQQQAEQTALLKALQASERMFRLLFENAREAIGVSMQGQIVFVNPAYAGLMGYASPEEMIGLSVMESVVAQDQARLTQIARRRSAGESVPFSYEFRGRKKDGAVCDLENYVSTYELDGQLYTVVTTRDITARKQEEKARQFLSEASAVLASSLDYEQTLQQVADLAVPHIADWCGIDRLEEDGSIRQLAVAHIDPEKVKWGHELRRRYPPDPAAPRGLPNVLRAGQPEIYSHISDEMLSAGARDAEHLEMIRQIGLDSLMIVPMIARGRILGAITFVATNESGHHYTKADLELAEGLSSRAAIAIDNARLYQAAQKELTERKKNQDALARHQEEIEALNVRLQRSMRETHHRVKNNLQVITALVNMQQMQYEEQVPIGELQRLTQHIRALASIHDLLTHQAQTDAEVSDISVQDVMDKLMPARSPEYHVRRPGQRDGVQRPETRSRRDTRQVRG